MQSKSNGAQKVAGYLAVAGLLVAWWAKDHEHQTFAEKLGVSKGDAERVTEAMRDEFAPLMHIAGAQGYDEPDRSQRIAELFWNGLLYLKGDEFAEWAEIELEMYRYSRAYCDATGEEEDLLRLTWQAAAYIDPSMMRRWMQLGVAGALRASKGSSRVEPDERALVEAIDAAVTVLDAETAAAVETLDGALSCDAKKALVKAVPHLAPAHRRAVHAVLMPRFEPLEPSTPH